MNVGAVALREGVLFVATAAKTARLRSFDLDGHRVGPELSFRDPAVGRSSASGLAVDPDRRLWVADAAAGLVRGLTPFGLRLVAFEPDAAPLEEPAGGDLAGPVDVHVAGGGEAFGLWIASGGRRRRAVGLHLYDGSCVHHLRSLGDPLEPFERVARVVARDERVLVLEPGVGRVQVFRRGDHLHAVALARPEARALAPLADGRLVLAHDGEAGGLVLREANGAERLLAPGSAVDAPPSDEAAGPGRVEDPVDLVVEEGLRDRTTRVALLDRGGQRVQVFNLEGRCYGAFAPFADEGEEVFQV